MSTLGPGDRPVKTRKVKVREHERTIPVRVPTAQQVRAQQQAYVSQGRAVAHAARQQRAVARARRHAAAQRATEVHDVKSNADLQRAEQFKSSPEYKKALSSAAYSGTLSRGGSATQAATEAGEALKRSQSSAALSRLEPDALKLFLQGQFETGRATVEDPLHVVPKTALGLGKFAVGIPAGIAETTVHPAAALQAAHADFERRYGVLAQPGGAKRFRTRIKQEGAAPELVEGVGSVLPTGVIAGRALQRLGETGRLGERAARIAMERPDLRVSGDTVREQPVSENFGRNVARAGVDTARRRVQARRARHQDAPIEVRQAQARGEVTYIRRGAQGRQQRVAVARDKSATLARMKAIQQQETQAARRNVRSLSKDERRGFKHAMQTGAMTPETARATIEKRIDIIGAERARLAVKRGAHVVSKRRDELPELQWLHEHAEKVFTPRLRKVVREEQAREHRLVKGDPGVDLEQAQLRRHAPQAEVLDIARAAGESSAQYLRRVKVAAREAGLERPGYFKSEERAKGAFSTFALGGQRATEIPKAYSGALFREGVESADPETLVRGVARNVKRSQQWNMVARTFEGHAVDKLGGRSMRNRSIVGLERDLENAGVDPASVAFWNPRRFYEASQRARSDVQGVARGEEDALEAGDVHAALRDAVVTAHDLRTRPEEFSQTRGWSVIPRAVHNELASQLRPSGLPGRVFDISKGKVSRLLLGNPAWLSFQVAANAFQTGLAGVGPRDWVAAQRWWRKLTPEQRLAIEPELGIHGWHDEQTHLGAATNARMVNAYRAFKTTTFYRRAHVANPLDVIFRADNAQNNFFRKAVAYNSAKRAAYKQMGENASRMMRAQQGINRLLGRNPTDRVLDAMRDPRLLERHAEAVRDFLGDYSSFTAKERRTLGRFTMFYGFTRYALRLAFYTMPVKHPVMTAIGLELGKLHDDELHRLFGEDVPVWEQGSAFIGGRRFALERMNPFFNAIQYSGPGSLAQIGSPLVAIVADQIAGKNVAFDQLWRVGGSTAYVIHGSDVGVSDRARIALASLLRLSPYYRAAEKGAIPGVPGLEGAQSDTSSLFFPEPTVYRQGPAIARNAKRVREQEATSAAEQAQRQFVPILGEPAAPVIERAQDYARSQGKQVPGDGGVQLTPAQARALARARRVAHRTSGAAQARALARARRAAAGSH